MSVRPMQADSLTSEQSLGWNGRSLAEMLAYSEQLFRETGHYQGVEELSIRQSDPIYYEKIWSRLRGGIVGARETAMNISGSPIVRELGELCFGLYSPEGDSVCVSTGIMAHIHTMSDAIKHMVRSEYETNPGISHGDIFVNNDPQLGDVHNADVQEFVPVIYQGELIAWAAGVTHELDVGAPQPTAHPIGITSRFEDGWILSCEKVGEKDRLNRDYEYRAQTATRMPFYWILDEKCRISGCQIIRDSVLRLVQEIGVDTYKRFIREVIEDTRRSFLKTVKTMLVPGKYSFAGFMNVTHGADKGRMPEHAAIDTAIHGPLEVTIEKDGTLELDLDGASKWGYHCFNATPTAVQAGLWVGLTQTLLPNDKVNDGAYLATNTKLPVGSWADPRNPLCSNNVSWISFLCALTGLFRALSTGFTARGFLEEVVAGYPWTGNATQGSGINHHGQNAAWTNFEMSCAGVSAGYVQDGANCCAAIWNPEGDMGDVEAWELLEPMLYLGRRMRPSSAGMGKQRGGSGFEAVRLLYGTEEQELYSIGNSNVFFGGGLFGGYPAPSLHRHNIRNTDMAERIAAKTPYPVSDRDPENSEMTKLVVGDEMRDRNSMSKPIGLEEYDLYHSVLSGGHGLGDVLDRRVDDVVKDLDDDLLLPRFAYSAYGVVAERNDDGKWVADAEATEARRAEIRKERLARAVPVSEWIEQQKSRVTTMDFITPIRKMYRESLELGDAWTASFKSFWELAEGWEFPEVSE